MSLPPSPVVSFTTPVLAPVRRESSPAWVSPVSCLSVSAEVGRGTQSVQDVSDQTRRSSTSPSSQTFDNNPDEFVA